MKSLIASFFILVLNFQLHAAKDLCTAVSQSDFQTVDKIIRKKIQKAARNKRDFQGNWDRLDSIVSWLQTYDCIQDAYWNKHDAFILTTTTFTRSIAVLFQTGDSLVEKCYRVRTHTQMFGDFLFWRFGLDVPNNRLKYLSVQSCPGFIKQHRDIDSLNQHNRIRDYHNYAVRFSADRVSWNKGRHSYIPLEEGQPIYIKLTVHNASDTLRKVVWPLFQNDGKKIVYFELIDEKGKSLILEDRNIGLPHNETITYDIIELKAGETRDYYHVIDGKCFNAEYPIECHHDLGVLLEGTYGIKVWYNPFVADFHDDVWLPREMDSLPFRANIPIKVVRSMAYNSRALNGGYRKESTSQSDRSELVFDIEYLEGSGDYLFGNGVMKYDGIGIIRAIHKGRLTLGDTIAFTIRHSDDKALAQNLEKGKPYRLYTTHSDNKYYRIVQPGSPYPYLIGKKNYQLINYPGSILEIYD